MYIKVALSNLSEESLPVDNLNKIGNSFFTFYFIHENESNLTTIGTPAKFSKISYGGSR